MVGIIAGFCLFIVLICLRINIIFVAPLSAAVIAVLNRLDVTDILNKAYVGGVSVFVQKFLLIFLLSSLLGKIMVLSGDARIIARFITKYFGPRWAAAGIMFATALISYGGLSGFLLIFTIYPIASSVFARAGLPKSLTISCISAGNVLLGIPAPGSSQIHNFILMDFFQTTATAGMKVGLTGVLFSTLFAVVYLQRRSSKLINMRVNMGEDLPDGSETGLFITVLPLLTVVVSLAVLNIEPAISLALGVLVSLVKNIKKISLRQAINESAGDAVGPMLYAASAAGFGEVLSETPTFSDFMSRIIKMPLNPYVLVGIMTNISVGLLGSASGGILLTLSTVGDQIKQLGDPEVLHRIMLLAATCLDTLPNNSAYLAMLAYTGLKLRETYFDYFMVTVVAPLIGLTAAIISLRIISL
ncbi:MAG: hypothetical protein QHH10_13280 [Peptococcaceae bacterium]|jgi:H+/gluconate symporter-like permease|nr:hypothetical protein [Peptococcaceae bacterium]MDH7526268.1 hypothetical protein [Peptococcaceae bacterium]